MTVVSYDPGTQLDGQPISALYSNPLQVLGTAQDDETLNYASLGFGGSLVVSFGGDLYNTEGSDVWLLESSPAGDTRERVRVLASQDGVIWNLLGESSGDLLLDLGNLSWVRYLKVVDISDPAAFTAPDANGYDVDGLGGFACGEVTATTALTATSTACTAMWVESYEPGRRRDGAAVSAEYTQFSRVLGVAQDDGGDNYASLGFDGHVMVSFDGVVLNTNGADVWLKETSAAGDSRDYAIILASQDGLVWHRLGEGRGDGEFELGELAWARYIQVIDDSDLDAFAASDADGFDLDAVGGFACVPEPPQDTTPRRERRLSPDEPSLEAWNRVVMPRGSASVAQSGCDFSPTTVAQLISDINTANGNTQADTICLVTDGTYTFTTEYDSSNALPDIESEITIEGQGATFTRSGTNTFRFLEVDSDGTLTINNLTLDNGNAEGSSGGAIQNDGGVLIISNSTFTNNEADGGGAIDNNEAASLTVIDSDFSGNEAVDDGGGAIDNDADATLSVSGSTFSDNDADEGGGAINNDGSVTVSTSTFSDNIADTGGAIDNDVGATLSVSGSTFSDNDAITSGGAIDNSDGTLTITVSTFTGNQANTGGAVDNQTGSGVVTISGSTFTNNSAQYGGALDNDDGVSDNMTVSGSTFTSNTATFDGGAIHNDGGDMTVTDSSFTTNTSGRYSGAIDNDGDLTVTGSSFTENEAGERGGALLNNVTLLINGDSLLEGNLATEDDGYGGGLHNNSSGSVTLEDVVIQDGSARYGGGIRNNGTLDATTVQLVGNMASVDGGGIYNDGALTMSESQLKDNTALDDGGAIDSRSSATATVNDSCIMGNSNVAVETSSATAQDFTENWWGAVDGPSGAGPGSGDSVSSNIDYSDFLTADNCTLADDWRLMLSPTNAGPNATGFTQTMTALLLDPEGEPADGQSVNFVVSGDNATTDSATTNALGIATFSYVGDTAGTDTVQASIPGLQSNASTITWSTALPPTGLVCVDWRDGQAHGWADNTPSAIIWDSSGMHGNVSPSQTVMAYHDFSSADPRSIQFETNGVGSFNVYQGSSAPSSGNTLPNSVSPDSGNSYLVTQQYVQVVWTHDPGAATIFYSHCYDDAENQAPVVDAGDDVSLPDTETSHTLDGSATDDMLPPSSSLTYLWEQISGPAGLSFTDDTDPETDISFSASGTYVLRLTADDSDLMGSDEMTLYVGLQPDLTVTLVDTSLMHVDYETLDISGQLAAEIGNIGDTLVATTFTVTFFLDQDEDGVYDSGEEIATTTHDALSPDTSLWVVADIEPEQTIESPGESVYAFVDSGDVVTEFDEDNNYGTTILVCSSDPTFDIELEWEWTPTTASDSDEVITTPLIADVNGDDIPDIVFSSYDNDVNDNGYLRAIQGDNGDELFTIGDDANESAYHVSPVSQIAVGDIDGDGLPEIVAVHESEDYLVAFENDGQYKWSTTSNSTVFDGISHGQINGGPSLADLDQDGQVEVIMGRSVYSGSSGGDPLWTGAYGAATHDVYGPLSIAADLDMAVSPDGNPTLEVVAGNTAYHADGSVYWERTSALPDGFNAIGNFDADVFPEIVLVGNGNIYVLQHTGDTLWGPVSIPNAGGEGGPPTVANFDSDSQLEIGVAGEEAYVVFDTDPATGLSVKWKDIATFDRSGLTGSTVFDFDGDGVAEVVYGDEVNLRVYRGSGSGGGASLIWSTASPNGTGYELPTIADIDGDGQAEIIKATNNLYTSGPRGIQIYGDANNNWVNTRQIWNQHSYHITNVNTDGTIPTVESNNWEIYNNYRQQVLPECGGSLPDLTASYIRKDETDPDDHILTVRVANGGGRFVPSGVDVAFYDGDPRNGGTLIDTSQTANAIKPGDYEDVSITVALQDSTYAIWAVADDDGTGVGAYAEIDELNNIVGSRVYLTAEDNEAPDVTADANTMTITVPGNTLTLDGTVSDDGYPIAGALNQTWSLVSGPGSVEFDDASAEDTDVTFKAGSESGDYTFLLTADDGELTNSDDVVVSVTSNLPTDPPVCEPDPVQGFIDAPINESLLTGQVDIDLDMGTSLDYVSVYLWQVNHPNESTLLAELASASGGSTLAELDTTQLANDSYTICVLGWDSSDWVTSGVMVTVTGENKPGRVRFSTTDLVVPITGLPITIGRTYDSLERDYVGDFGHGWTLDIANPRLEIDAAENVTMTMPDGRRSTFYFTPYAPSAIFGFLSIPDYTPEPGVYGSLESNGCGLLTVSGGSYFCFPGNQYGLSVSAFTYTDPYGREFALSADGRLQSITDLNGNTLTFTEDGIISDTGLDVDFQRDALGRIRQITDPEGNIYQYGYDANGDLVSVDLPDVDSNILYDYYEDHFFKSGTDPRGNRAILTTYDADGRLESVTDALDNTTDYAYDLNANTTTITYPDTGEETLTYNDDGYLTQRVSPISDGLDQTMTFTYDKNHNLLSERNEDVGETIAYTYNGNGQRTTVIDPRGVPLITAEYNQFGGPTDLTDALDRTTSITYDATTFMPLSASDSLGSLGAFAWDAQGNPETRTDAEGADTNFTYDAYGNVTEVEDPLLRTTSATYDTLGRRQTTTDNDEQTTTFVYDALGRLVAVTGPEDDDEEQPLTLFEYDGNGNRVAVVDPIARRTEYVYNGNNNLVEIRQPDDQGANTIITEYEYDWRGNLISVTDPTDVVTEYEYNLAGWLTKVTTQHEDASQTVTDAETTYSYDAAGRRTQMTDPVGTVTTYTYDNAGRLTDVMADPTGIHVVTHYDYNDLGQVTAMTEGFGTGEARTTSYTYDDRGRLERITHPDSSFVDYDYDGVGRVTSITDEQGRITEYEYDEAGQLEFRIMASGTSEELTTAYAYDPVGRLAEVTRDPYDATLNPDGLDATTRYEYDALGRRTDMFNPEDDQTTYTYDLVGQLDMLTRVDPSGPDRVTGYEYDNLGRLVTTTYPDSTTSTIAYDDAGRRESFTDEEERVTEYEYDAGGRLQIVTRDPSGLAIATRYDYDEAGRRISVRQDPSGINATTQYTYDALGRLEQVTRLDDASPEQMTCYTYNIFGQTETVMQVTDLGNPCNDSFNPQVTEFTYNDRGWLTRTDYADSTFTTATYNDAGQILTSADQIGTLTAYAYDDAGRLDTVTRDPFDATLNPDGIDATTSYSYDALWRQTQVTDPLGNVTLSEYDLAGRLTDLTRGYGSADAATTHYVFDAFGQIAEMTQGFGETEAYTMGYEYDDRGRQTFVFYDHPTNNNSTETVYNDAGQVFQDIDQNGIVTEYSYDDIGRLTDVTFDADTSQITTSYLYDDLGNVIRITDPENNTTDFTYNDLSQLTDKDWADGTTTEAFEYDVVGNLIQHDLPGNDGRFNQFAYDDMNRLVEEVFFVGVMGEQYSTTYTYTDTGQRDVVTVNNSITYVTDYDYDALYRPDVVEHTENSITKTVDYTFDNAGNLTALDIVEDSLSYDYTYDAVGRVESVTDANGQMDYTYNALGLVTELDRPNGITTFYSYDALARLNEIDHQDTGGSLTRFEYTLDPTGTRTRVDEFVNNTLTGYITWDYDDLYRLTEEARYNASSTLITETDFTYDDVGNRETQTVDTVTTTYTYNDLNQLDYSVTSSVTTDYEYDLRGNLLNVDEGDDDDLEVEYAYTAEDELAGAIIHDTSDIVIAYGYDADGRRVQQNEDGTVTNYLWDEYSMYGDVVMEYGSTGTPIVDYTLAEGQLLAQDRGAVSYYLPDAQGSVRALANGSGTITDTYDYTAFGELYGTPSGSTVNSYLYTSQMFDNATGLYSLRARDYDPFVGRFLSQDTFPVNYRNPIELNRYGYVANSPINFSDPSGNLKDYGILTFQNVVTATTATIVGYLVYNSYCEILEAIGFSGFSNFCGLSASSIASGDTEVDVDVDIPTPNWDLPSWPDFGGGGDVSDGDIELPDTGVDLPPDIIPGTSGGDGDSSSDGDSGGGGPSLAIKAGIVTVITALASNLALNSNPATSVDPLTQQQSVHTKVDVEVETTVDNDPVACDPPTFAAWWMRLGPPNPGGVNNAYEQNAAQGLGTMGDSRRVPTGLGEAIDADGADPSTCRLIEAKGAQDINNPAWQPGGFQPILDQADDQIRRYRDAVNFHQVVLGLEIRTNSNISRDYFEGRLLTYGFIINVDGFAVIH
jgi:RHS repeat-associated protein